MRNRIKGYWSWEDVGILPAELGPKKKKLARPVGVAATARKASRSNDASLAIAGGVLAGLALVWALRAVLRRI